MEIFSKARIIVDYKKGYGVFIKGNLTTSELHTLRCYFKDYKCRFKVDFAFGEITIYVSGKDNVELLQDENFKKLLFNPDFNVLEHI